MGLQTKKFLHSKGNNQQNEKATCGMVENICKPYILYELIYKTYKKVIQLKREKIIQLKMAMNPIDIFPKTHKWPTGMKRSSTLLIIRKIQIKTTMRYHLTLARMAISKKSKVKKYYRSCGKKGTSV